MNRALFRGLRTDGKGWVYGYYYATRENTDDEINIHRIVYDLNGDSLVANVIPETVGQFTGLIDRNGTEIFDGDVIKVGIKYGFNSELLDEFMKIKCLPNINNIGLHFTGIIRVDFKRGLMFENIESGYKEPMFSRHINIRHLHECLEVISNINEK